MNASVLLSKLASGLLLPPMSLVLLCLAGWLVRRRRPRLGDTLMLASLVMLVLLSTRVGTAVLVTPLENRFAPASAEAIARAQAIVILGGDRLQNAPEYGNTDQPGVVSLKRLAYAATLHRQSGLPILITGGRPGGEQESEAAMSARTLRATFGVETRWQEDASNNTAENAVFSAAMLQREGIRRVLLVTDALHMSRSVDMFNASGLEAIPAPTLFMSTGRVTVSDFIPRARILAANAYALHEWIGMGWYDLRYSRGASAAIPQK